MRPVAATEYSTSKPKRKQAKRACTKCRAAKAGCSDSRPCRRCISLNIGHLCSDAPAKPKNGDTKAFDSITPLFSTHNSPIPSLPSLNSQETTSSLFGETTFDNFTNMHPTKTNFDTQGLIMSPIDASRLSLPILPAQQQQNPQLSYSNQNLDEHYYDLSHEDKIFQQEFLDNQQRYPNPPRNYYNHTPINQPSYKYVQYQNNSNRINVNEEPYRNVNNYQKFRK